MEQVDTARASARAQAAANQVPAPHRPGRSRAAPSPPRSTQNVQVLGDVDADEFTRLMSAITEWVSPEQGCAYCHAEGEELSSDSLYTKVVARRMLQMTQHINADWQPHVGATGVTCYTCHRGKHVPTEHLVQRSRAGRSARAWPATTAGQNTPAPRGRPARRCRSTRSRRSCEQDNDIRVVSTTALPEGNRQSIKQTEWTYGLMMHMSEGAGRELHLLPQHAARSPPGTRAPARSTAWYGIRMVRDLNNAYLEPLLPTYPRNRLGPLGDAPKANCATCHQGAYKPL